MELYNIVTPTPRKAEPIARTRFRDMKTSRSNSGTDLTRSKKAKTQASGAQLTNPSFLERRPRSATPLNHGKLGATEETDTGREAAKARLKHYNLDYLEDREEHFRQIYDVRSRWFCRDVKPDFVVEDCLPYRVETHTEQAKYLCHILVNLYVAVSSLDIQGLVSISMKDLGDLKSEIDELVMSTDMFRLSSDENDDGAFNDIHNFDEDEDDEFDEMVDVDGLSFSATGRITAKSTTIINVNHWANELKNCLHFEFPVRLRKSLALVFYTLSLVQGQKVYRPMYVDLFEALVSTDDEGTNFTELLLDAGLRLDYKPMKGFLDEFLPSPDAEYTRFDVSTKADNQLFRLLLKLSHIAKPFYGHDDNSILKKTMDHFISSLSPLTAYSVFPIITSFVPYHYQEDAKITDYFPFLFTLWTTTTPSVGFDTHLYDFVGCIAEDAHSKLLRQESPRLERLSNVSFEKFGLLTEDQINFIFNRIQNHLRNDFQIVSFSRTVRPLIYCINGSNSGSFFDKLRGLVKSLETFAHPSNTGPWTKVIAKFVHGFIKMYHRRVKFEENSQSKFKSHLKLNQSCHTKLVDTFYNVIFLGAQNKNSDMTNYYISCLAYMLDIDCQNKKILFNRVLLDLYDSLADLYIHSAHRLISSLKQFTKAARFMIQDPLFRVHITNLLSMLVAKLEFNDLALTSNIMNCIVSISSFIPLENFVKEGEYLSFESHTLPFIEEHVYSLKDDNSSSDFPYDGDALSAAFRASTTVFENIISVYLKKVFQLVDCDLEEGFISKINQTSMIMIESMSDPMFQYFVDVLERLFWENDYFKEREPNYELITIPLGAAIRRDAKLGQRMFFNLTFNIKDQIRKGAGSIRSSSEIQHRDVKLLTYLTALSDIVRQSRSSMLDYKEELKDLLFHIFDSISNPPLDVHTSLVLHNVLKSLTSTEVVDFRLFQNNCNISDDEKWGGLQFDERRFSKENTTFEWHVPTVQEVEFAAELLEEFTDYCSKKISEMMRFPEKDSAYSDKLKKYILIITHTLSGSSLLFDADYNKHRTELRPVDSYKNKLLLLKSIRDKRCDSEEPDAEQVKSDSGADSEADASVELFEDALDEIHINDSRGGANTDDFLFNKDSSSNLPSGIATPEPGLQHSAHTTGLGMSGTFAFRDLDIFSCNYFFGFDPHKRMMNPTYLKIQSIRSKIGSLFHSLFKFFSQNFEDNTILFKILLHGIKVWFADVGQETLFKDEPTSILDMDFLENIQNLSHLYEPYTRTCLASKAHTLHEARVLLHSANRTPSKLEKVLLRDILKLSMSLYPNIFKPAQGCMVLAMKQLMGSYPIVMKHVLSAFQVALDEGEHKKIEVILELLMIKKIHRKIMSDYVNLGQVLDLLFKACRITDFNVSKYAEKIMTDISICLKVPSSVCLIDKPAIEELKPADASILPQVLAVQKAKDSKRRFYISLLEKLQDFLIGLLESEDDIGWKVSTVIMKLTSKLQSSLELTTSKEVLPVILKLTRKKHPSMVHLAIKSFLNICNKITALGDCDYDLKNAFDFDFLKNNLQTIDTNTNGFGEEFSREMQNFERSNFYIDSKAYVGYVAWGRRLKVIKSSCDGLFNLKTSEMNCLKEFGQYMTKDWVHEICQILIQDNEGKGIFSSSNIEFFGLLVALNTNNCTKICYEDMLDLCESLYDKSDKSSMIMSVEIMAGLIVASKMTSQENFEKRDKFLAEFLDTCLDHELNQDAVDIWSILCWWLPTSVDLRRCVPLYKKLFEVKDVLDTSSDSSADQASKISLLRNLLLSLDFRTPHADQVLSSLIMDHPYDQVRQAISKLLSTLLQSQLSPSFQSVHELIEYTSNEGGLGRIIRKIPTHFDQKLKDAFIAIESERQKVVDLPAHEILKTRYYYMAATMLNWVMDLMKGQNSVVLVLYLEHYLAPFLMHLIRMKDVCILANLEPTACYVAISFWSLRKEYISIFMRLIESMDLKTSHELRVQLVFVENFYSKNMLQLSEEEKESVLRFVVRHIYNESFVEVRLRAAEALSGIIHTLSDAEKPAELMAQFARGLGSHSSAEKKALSKTDTKIHSSVIGLGAVISAFPYAFPLPKWIPPQLSGLSSWARTGGMSGAAAKEIISDFKKVRADTWHLDRASFTPEELEDLEGVLWRSYYA
ncbi:LAME_0A03312g1_1 [Lachancea meyersii CBS 8951]|uniref:LAME_0A03312g1_1 n=1 Tax=Lachancea meyersii CBS 8951 TaxID=1266667 RepID=A0A1G4IN63_9SACH|nr:LAME_0A03312g1_1 [Lachancea meyersii CBS 8951]